MKITKELIKKYALNKCSEEEIRSIEKWLDSENDLQVYKNHEEFKPYKEKVWQNVSKTRVIKRSILHYAAACTILFITVFGAFKMSFSKEESKEFASVTSNEKFKKTTVDGSQLEFTSESSHNTTKSVFYKISQIAFYGKLNSKSTEKSNIKNKHIISKLNKNYYAFTIKDKNEEKLYVLNKKQVLGLPKHLAVKAH